MQSSRHSRIWLSEMYLLQLLETTKRLNPFLYLSIKIHQMRRCLFLKVSRKLYDLKSSFWWLFFFMDLIFRQVVLICVTKWIHLCFIFVVSVKGVNFMSFCFILDSNM